MAIIRRGNRLEETSDGVYAYGYNTAAGTGSGSLSITGGSIYRLGGSTPDANGYTNAVIAAGGAGATGSIGLIGASSLRVGSASVNETLMGLGVAGGLGELRLSQNSTVSLTGSDLASLSVGASEGNGTVVLDDSQMTLTAANGVAAVFVNDGSNGTRGTLTLSNDSLLSLSGEAAGLIVQGSSGGSGTMDVLSGSIVDLQATAGAGAAIVSVGGSSAATMTIDGTDSAVLVDGTFVVQNGTVTVSDGGAIDAWAVQIADRETMTLSGGTIETDAAGLDADSGSVQVAGTLLVDEGTDNTIVGDLVLDSFGELEFDLSATGEVGGLTIENGRLDLGFEGNIVLDASGYRFAADETIELVRYDDDTLSLGNGPGPTIGLSVRGQGFGFASALHTTRVGDQTVVAMTALEGPDGEAVLRFGATETRGATLTLFDGAGFGTGGRYGSVTAFAFTSVEGTAGADTFDYSDDFGTANATMLGGNDVLVASAYGNVVDGGAGTDTVQLGTFNTFSDAIIDLSGAQTVYNGEEHTFTNFENATGSRFADVLLGSAGNNVLDGGAGDDRLEARGGNDRILGGSGDDTVLAGAGDDIVYGQDGNDSISGGDGADGLSGGNGADVIAGGAGADRLFGDAGNDTLRGEGDDDLLSGGTGNDRLYGGEGADRLLGGEGGDRLEGEAGDDIVYGQAGNDRLYGQDGNDGLAGGAGIDVLFGGNGADRLFGQADDDFLYGQNGNDALYGGAGVDRLYGGNGDDRILGGDDRDLVYGEAGNDILYGDGGSDFMRGGAGNDGIAGGVGNDSIYGDSGNDRLFGQDGDDGFVGGFGDDAFYGGAGADRFLFTNQAGDDRIMDFARFEAGEVIDLSRISDITDYEDMRDNHLRRVNDELVITYEGIDETGAAATGTITIGGVSLLSSDDFVF